MNNLILIKLFRTLRYGILNIVRNGWLSLATISVIVIALFIVNIQIAVIFANYLFLKDAEDKINISVYFKADVGEEEIRNIKKEIEQFPEVAWVSYESKEKVLEEFKEMVKDEKILKSIEELDYNPFGAILKIKAKKSDQYKAVNDKIEQLGKKDQITSINYYKYQPIIDGLSQQIKSNQKVTLLLSITLCFVAILITFNSIRMTIYSHREEIEIMRLVGASNRYIQLPFIWEGIFYGLSAAVVSILISFFYLGFISKGTGTESFLPFSNTTFLKEFFVNHFIKNIFLILGIQFILGVFLGIVSSLIAIRRYLKV